VKRERERAEEEALLVEAADRLVLDEQRTLDALEEQRMLMEERAYKENVDHYAESSETLIVRHLRPVVPSTPTPNRE
jgi:hypothetical protein